MHGMPANIAHVPRLSNLNMLLDQCCLHFQEHFGTMLEHRNNVDTSPPGDPTLLGKATCYKDKSIIRNRPFLVAAQLTEMYFGLLFRKKKEALAHFHPLLLLALLGVWDMMQIFVNHIRKIRG